MTLRVNWGPRLPESRGERILFRPSWKMWRIFREISCGRFSSKLKGENLQNFSPKFHCVFRPCQQKIRLNFALGNLLHKVKAPFFVMDSQSRQPSYRLPSPEIQKREKDGHRENPEPYHGALMEYAITLTLQPLFFFFVSLEKARETPKTARAFSLRNPKSLEKKGKNGKIGKGKKEKKKNKGWRARVIP